VRRLLRLTGVALLARLARGSAPPPVESAEEARTYPELERDTRDELVVAALLLGCAAAGSAFVVIYLVSGDTQLLGAALGLGLLLAGAALIVASAAVVPHGTDVEPRDEAEPVPDPPSDILAEIGAGVTRRRLLAGAAGLAGAALGAAALVPVASIGPVVSIGSSPWRAGRKLVDENGDAITPDMLETGSFLTAYPQGLSRETLGAPLIVVRIDPSLLHPPANRRGWSVEGILAFSKVCPHAGCAVAMLRYPLYGAHAPRPALVCPCHYSTFDVGDAGRVLFGPAGRPLPQLPLRLGSDGTLEAAGTMSDHVGPTPGTIDW
jgi:ubiquinol-cytochrome c reductase iron-sulfur subunit